MGDLLCMNCLRGTLVNEKYSSVLYCSNCGHLFEVMDITELLDDENKNDGFPRDETEYYPDREIYEKLPMTSPYFLKKKVMMSG